MLKQNDAVIIFVILAAVIGVLILSSNTASLVLVGALAMIFGGLIGVRLRKSRASEDEKEEAEVVIKEEAAQPSTQASSTVETRSELEPDTAVQVAEGAMSPSVPTTVARPQSRGETAAPSQVALLKNLVASVSEGITFKDSQGRYISANAAFAQMLGSRPSEIIGRDDAGVFGHLTAKSLLESDDAAALQGRISTTLEVPLPNGPRYFEITKASVNNDDDNLEGIVSVWRDVTEPALHRIRREKAMHETIVAFTNSIELRDSYLGDHAQRLAMMAMAVTDVLGLDEEVRTTVELAAYLSQIGKLGVNAQLLGQQRRFTEQEIKEMQKHVHNTARVLRDLDFG